MPEQGAGRTASRSRGNGPAAHRPGGPAGAHVLRGRARLDRCGSGERRHRELLGAPNAAVAGLLAALVLWGSFRTFDFLPRRGWRHLGKTGLAAVLAGTAAMTYATQQTWWGVPSPLSWTLYILLIGVLSAVALLLVVAVVLGTPGCESGVIPHLVATIRGRGAVEPPVHFCLGGLHRIDAWEARQAWHR